MPQTLSIGILVLGAVMLLLALAGGGFKIFGQEAPAAAGRTARVIALVIGVGLVGFSLWHFSDGDGSASKAASRPPPSASGPQGQAALIQAPAATTSAPAPPAATLTDPATAQVYDDEATDFGVPPTSTPIALGFAPTPLTIPGARTITTGELLAALRARKRMLLIDVLAAAHDGIPGARHYPGTGLSPPSIDLGDLLRKDTGGDMTEPVVFYCAGSRCWESYNAALRAVEAGFTNIYWYRGGLDAWRAAGWPSA